MNNNSKYYRCPRCDKLILFKDEAKIHEMEHKYDDQVKQSSSGGGTRMSKQLDEPKNVKSGEIESEVSNDGEIQCWCGKKFKTEKSKDQHEFMVHL